MCFDIQMSLLFPISVFLGHQHRHKRHKAKRRPMPAASLVPDAPPLVGARIFSDLESLGAGLLGESLRRTDSSPSGRPSNDSGGDSGPHRRSKRFLSYPRFVEVMLVADSKMVEHHGSNLQHYILTLMSIVSHACRPRGAVGGKRATGGRGKHCIQTAPGKRGIACLTALMNGKNKLRYVAWTTYSQKAAPAGAWGPTPPSGRLR